MNKESRVRTSEVITKGSAVLTEQSIRKWFDKLKIYLTSIGSEDILQDPSRIYNGDETGFSMCPKKGLVLAEKGVRQVYNIAMGNEKENCTVLFVFNSSGAELPPLVVFPLKRISKKLSEAVPGNFEVGISDKVWMTSSEAFFDYISGGFNNWLSTIGWE